MTECSKSAEFCRIALVWDDHRIQAQKTFHGICRRAGMAANVTLQRFDAFQPGFERGIAQPLAEWKPDGVVVKMNRWDQLKILRRMLPGIPIVSTLSVSSELVDTCVVSNINEVVTLARDHFQSQGVPRVAMFCSAICPASTMRVAAFRAAVPDGFELEFDAGDSPGGPRVVMDWLASLPTPVGVMALEIGAGSFVLECCREIGLRVPEDVQIIGADDDDVSLASEPHLTSVRLPGTRIGEMAMSAMLGHLHKESPPPAGIIEVNGSILVARGSTGPVSVGSARIAQALGLMQSRISKGYSIERLASLAGMGVTNFYKEFMRATGCTPAEYMRQLRFHESCRMLRETSATVTRIAIECGFPNLISFVQFFRRQAGETPTAYRKRAKIESDMSSDH